MLECLRMHSIWHLLRGSFSSFYGTEFLSGGIHNNYNRQENFTAYTSNTVMNTLQSWRLQYFTTGNYIKVNINLPYGEYQSIRIYGKWFNRQEMTNVRCHKKKILIIGDFEFVNYQWCRIMRMKRPNAH